MSPSFISLTCVRACALTGSEPPELTGGRSEICGVHETQITLMTVCVNNLPNRGKQTESEHAAASAAPQRSSDSKDDSRFHYSLVGRDENSADGALPASSAAFYFDGFDLTS